MPRERYTPEQQAFYRDYMSSAAWRARRAARIALAGGRCEFISYDAEVRPVRCYRTISLTVHHNTYERLGHELDADLDVLCWFHHMVTHLLWVPCKSCKDPILATDANGESWLARELKSLGLLIDLGPIIWKNLPSKDDLVNALLAERNLCDACQHHEKE